MEKLIDFCTNNFVGLIVLVIIVFSLAGCTGWKNVIKPPVQVDVVTAVDGLYEVLKIKIDEAPEAKEITRKILEEIKSKIPLLSDGNITVNDAFTEVLLVTPTPYKPFVIGLKLFFNTYYGDFGKEIPAEQRARIKTLTKVIGLLEGKLKQ